MRDAQGAPLTVFHGTGASEAIAKFAGNAYAGWFSERAAHANAYTSASLDSIEDGAVYPVHLAITNPLDLTHLEANAAFDAATLAAAMGASASVVQELFDEVATGDQYWNLIDTPSFREWVDALQYDGVKVREGGAVTWAALHPTQIKSALGNRGTYDPQNPDIRFRRNEAATLPPALSAEARAANLRTWFGNSAVVDAEGRPLRVFHGTDRAFTVFDPQAPRRALPLPGMFFTPHPAVANTYASYGREIRDDDNWVIGAEGGQVLPCYLSLQNPVHLQYADRETGTLTSWKVVEGDVLAGLAAGHDGAIIEGWADGSGPIQYVAFRPSQIKSAIGNVGNFDAADPDIRFARHADSALAPAGVAEARVGAHVRADVDPEVDSDAVHFAQLAQTGFWGREGAGALIMARDTGRLLMPERSEDVLEPGTYGTWGGAIDAGEDPARAVRREVKEEAGYDGHVELVPLLVFEAPGFRYYNYLAIVDHEFTPELNWETAAADWRDAGDWPAPLHPGVEALLADPASMAKLSTELAKVQYARWKATASAGLPTHQRRDEAAFASWFANSCAVDDKGAPMVLFHGTRAVFSCFEPGRVRADSTAEPDPGFFFTTDPVVAAQYAGCDEHFPAPDIGSVMAVHLRVTNPLVHDFEGGKHGRKDVIARAIAGGHDGVVLRNHYDVGGVGDQWVVFAPEQIKSIWNAGTFDPSTPDIRFARDATGGLPPTVSDGQGAVPDAAPGVLTSEAFRRWFGRSAIVTPDGRPQRMYHGSQQDITTFAPSATGALGPGVYLSSDPDEAAFWARRPGNAARNVVPVYVAIQNPYVWTPEDDFRWPLEVNADARRAGHDGIIKQWADGACEVVAFASHQIKSAFNAGTYDASNPDIRYARDASRAIVTTPATPSRPTGPAKATRDDSLEP